MEAALGMCQVPRTIRVVIPQVKKWGLEQGRDSPKVTGKTGAGLPLSSAGSATARRYSAHGDIYYLLHYSPPSLGARVASPDAVCMLFYCTGIYWVTSIRPAPS